LSSSSSSSSYEGDPSGAVAERAESEDTEIAAVETVSGAGDFAADASSADIGTTSSTSSREDGMVSRTSAKEDEVSMDELRAAESCRSCF
jgi:hypothetical protein